MYRQALVFLGGGWLRTLEMQAGLAELQSAAVALQGGLGAVKVLPASVARVLGHREL